MLFIGSDMAKKKIYAVARGRRSGLFSTWPEAEAQVKGYGGARYKGFANRAEAEAWLRQEQKIPGSTVKPRGGGLPKASRPVASHKQEDDHSQILIYTDGGCSGNPGPGGYGAVILHQGRKQELSGGYRLTTNNRMELMACIKALQNLADHDLQGLPVVLTSDSSYVVNAVNKGWARSWQRRGWVKSDNKPALNPDLWQELLALIGPLKITFRWIKGHAGHPLNERCDRLAVAAAKGRELPPDQPYEELNGAG